MNSTNFAATSRNFLGFCSKIQKDFESCWGGSNTSLMRSASAGKIALLMNFPLELVILKGLVWYVRSIRRWMCFASVCIES